MRRSVRLLAFLIAVAVVATLLVAVPAGRAAYAAAAPIVHGRDSVATGAVGSRQWPAGRVGDRYLLCDWNGDGTDTLGIFRPSNRTWYVMDESGSRAEAEFLFGRPGFDDTLLCGDWTGDGVDGPGIYSPSSGRWDLRWAPTSGPANLSFRFGRTGMGDRAVTGDWNGDGTDTPGLFRTSDRQWHLTNEVGGGPAATIFAFGRVAEGEQPLVGDWDGDGIDTPGIFRRSNAEWHITDANKSGPATTIFAWARADDIPIVGDWDGDGSSETAVVRGSAIPEVDLREVSSQRLYNALRSRISGLVGNYAVSVRQIGGLGVSTSVDGDGMYEPASTIKVFAAYAALRRLEAGTLSWDRRTTSGTTVRDCMRVMIHISDNPCHSELIALLGGGTQLNREFAAAGFSRTVYQGVSASGQRITAKRTTTKDMALLLERLERGTLLGPSASNHLRSLMISQIWRAAIPAGIAPGILQASKPGGLWVEGGMTMAGASIIYARNATYVITILGRNGANDFAMAAISRVAYDHFDGPQAVYMTYPKANLVTTRTTGAFRGPGTSYLRSVPEGTRVEAEYSARLWYQVKLGGQLVYIHSGSLRNRYE